jgi:hypothetical protein
MYNLIGRKIIGRDRGTFVEIKHFFDRNIRDEKGSKLIDSEEKFVDQIRWYKGPPARATIIRK